MSPHDKPLAWLHGEIKTPPFSPLARIEAGFFLRSLQAGEGKARAAKNPDRDDEALEIG